MIAAFDAEEQEAAAEEAKKAEAVKEAASSDKPLTLPKQLVQLVSLTLTWLKNPSIKKKGEEMGVNKQS